MKTAIIGMGDLIRENRWDAPFHIALSELKERVAQLRSRYSDEEAVATVLSLDLKTCEPMNVLVRGQQSLNARNVATVAREYPHLSLALVERDVASAVTRVREAIAERSQLLDRLLSIAGDDSKETAR